MRPNLPKRLCIPAVLVASLLVSFTASAPAPSQAAPQGYARLLGHHAAAIPDAVTDCRMAAVRLRAVCPADAAIPEAAFENLRLQCRQAAQTSPSRPATARM